MARAALRALDNPAVSAAKAAAVVKATRVSKLKGKKLKNLSAKEKDLLLKELAIRAGLLEDDGDD